MSYVAEQVILKYARETVKCCSRKGDLAVVNDSDGGGRCCSIRKRFSNHTNVVSGPTRSMSWCDMTAFSYARNKAYRAWRTLPISAKVVLPLKGEMAV